MKHVNNEGITFLLENMWRGGWRSAANGLVTVRHIHRVVREVHAADGGTHAPRPLHPHVPRLRQPAAVQA